VVAAVAVAAITSLGNGLRKLLFPMRAVAGVVRVDGKPVVRAELELDRKLAAARTDAAGTYLLERVSDGMHELRVRGRCPRRGGSFVVPRNAVEHRMERAE
jgi:hypothetical protein